MESDESVRIGVMAQVGSAGTAVAAALEFAGQYMQGRMLAALDGGALTTIGLIFYVFAAMAGLLTLANGGKYKHALTFLLGPPIYFFIVSPGSRLSSDGVTWQLGLDATRYDQEEVKNALREITDESGLAVESKKVEVTAFFALWDRFISTMVASFSELVLRFGDENSDRTFLNKVERYLQLFQENIRDPALKEFVQRELVHACGEYFQALLYLNVPTLSAGLDNISRDKLNAIVTGSIPQVNISERPRLAEWIQQVGGETELKEVYTCQELWALTVKKLLRAEANRVIDLNTTTALPIAMVAGGEGTDREAMVTKLSQEIRKKLAAKMLTQVDVKNGELELHSVPDTEVDALLVNEVAARMLVREISQLNPNIAQLHYIPREDIRREKVGDQGADVSEAIREIGAREEWRGKGDFLVAALSIPYVQGLALFFLAMLFPFFAMSIMVPGKHHVFFQWMTLWAWVKSWDVGMAVVMVIDEFLHLLMPHGPPITDQMVEDPSALFKVLFEVDPVYSANTYYNIIATLMLSVPVLTGFLVKKGANELIGAITEGAHNFAVKTGGAMALYQGSLQAQSNIVNSNQLQYAVANPAGPGDMGSIMSQVMSRAVQDPEVFVPLTMATLSKGAAQEFLRGAGLDQSSLDKLMVGLAGKTAEQLKAVALEKYKLNLASEIRDAGLSYKNRRYAFRAIQNGWYSHDVIYGVPIAQYTALAKARNAYRPGGVLTYALNRPLYGLRGQVSKVVQRTKKLLTKKDEKGKTLFSNLEEQELKNKQTQPSQLWKNGGNETIREPRQEAIREDKNRAGGIVGSAAVGAVISGLSGYFNGFGGRGREFGEAVVPTPGYGTVIRPRTAVPRPSDDRIRNLIMQSPSQTPGEQENPLRNGGGIFPGGIDPRQWSGGTGEKDQSGSEAASSQTRAVSRSENTAPPLAADVVGRVFTSGKTPMGPGPVAGAAKSEAMNSQEIERRDVARKLGLGDDASWDEIEAVVNQENLDSSDEADSAELEE